MEPLKGPAASEQSEGSLYKAVRSHRTWERLDLRDATVCKGGWEEHVGPKASWPESH